MACPTVSSIVTKTSRLRFPVMTKTLALSNESVATNSWAKFSAVETAGTNSTSKLYDLKIDAVALSNTGYPHRAETADIFVSHKEKDA